MSSRKRVLFVSSSLSGGGAERFTSNLLTHLDRSRFALSLCLLRDCLSYDLPDDVELTVLNEEGNGAVDIPLLTRARYKPWVLWRTIRCLSRQIDKVQPDVVISNIDQINCATDLALQETRHQPYWIARVGNNPFVVSRLLHFVRLRCYRRANLVVTNSMRMAEDFRKLYRLKPSRIRVIGNPVDFRRIQRLAEKDASDVPSFDEPWIVSVGRFAKQKRFDVLIDAVAEVQRHQPVRLCICGDGPLRPQLQREVRRRGMEETVYLPGFCNNPFPWMRRASVFAMTSDYEGLPNVLIEAQALGTPTVATRCDYGPDEIIVPDKTGLLVPTGNALLVARAVRELLEAHHAREEMGAAAAKRMRQLYSMKTILAEWANLIDQCG